MFRISSGRRTQKPDKDTGRKKVETHVLWISTFSYTFRTIERDYLRINRNKLTSGPGRRQRRHQQRRLPDPGTRHAA